ncbi:MAG: DNA polymerase I [Candidatus Aminicenantia bacterium]
MEKFVILDANSLIYRSFFAIKKLSTSDGFPTNAIYGFLSTLRKIINEIKPDYICIAMDAGGKTIRHQAYEKYKSERPPMPDDLQMQIPLIKKIISAYRISLIEISSYEADDVIGTLAEKGRGKGLEVVIATTDKDLFQLVRDGIKIYNPSKEAYLDEKGIEEFFGVKPSQVVDVLSLWGDPTDNVPGVPGIGEKGAKELIRKFGSLENLLQNIEKLKERYREAIKNNMESLLISKELVKVKTDLDIEFNLSDFKLKEGDLSELRTIFEALQFRTFLQELPKVESFEKDYRAILEEDELLRLVSEIKNKKRVSVDVETNTKSHVGAEIVGVSFSVEHNRAYYLPLKHVYSGAPEQIEKEKALKIIKDILEDDSIGKVGHNIKFDYIVFKENGIKIKNIVDDSMILSYLLDPNRRSHSLDELAMDYLSYKTTSFKELTEQEGKGTLDLIDINKVASYSCEDADVALILADKLREKIREEGLEKVYREIEIPLIEVLADMEIWGVKIDTEYISEFSRFLEKELSELAIKIYKTAGLEFNINSPKQVAEILFEKLNLPAIKRTTKGKDFSTDIEVLKELSSVHPVIPLILDFRILSKLKSTYCDSIYSLINPKTGRIHTSYNQAGTATGRLSSSEPNLQNIPIKTPIGKRFRRAFISEKGFSFLSADYSQIDLRVLAHFSEDQVLVSAFRNGEDIHERTASEVFGNELIFSPEERRRRAKIINFSIIYGTSAHSLSKELGVSYQQAQEFINRYFQRHRGVKNFIENLIKEAEANLYVKTLFGRRRYVPELRSSSKGVRNSGKRIAINSVIQGSAADLMKKAMIDVWKLIQEKGLRSRLVLQIHDEMILECHDEELEFLKGEVKRIFENVYHLKVPLTTNLSVGKNWEEV